MGTYQTVRIGRMTLREDLSVAEKAGGQIQLTGQESMPNVRKTDVDRKMQDLGGLLGELVPIQFDEKPSLNGFYMIADVNSTLTSWDGIDVVPWDVAAVRVGRASEIDMESRLSGAVTRVNDFSATGYRWHAPSIGAKAYWAGNVAPVAANRVGFEGTVKAYRNIGGTTNPRWAASVADYEKGRVRFIDGDGYERQGKSFDADPADWELNNSILRVRPLDGTTGTLEIAAWSGGAWRPKTWRIYQGTGPAVLLGTPTYVSVLWNQFETVVVRLLWDISPVGRMTADLTLRRGSPFVEVYLQHEFGTTLEIDLAAAEAGTAGSGYISATAADSNGLRYFIGSARSFTGDNVGGGISKAATATLDAAIGVVLDGDTGNSAAHLYQQYLGSPSESVQGVRR